MNTKENYFNILTTLGGIKPSVRVDKNSPDLNTIILNKDEILHNIIVQSDYVNFIQQFGAFTFNKGISVKGIDRIPVSDDDNRVSIDNFFNFFNDNASLIYFPALLKGNLPDFVFPICEAEAGDLIVMDLYTKNSAHIAYWHHEHSDDSSGLYLVANCFQEFMTKLFIYDDEVTADETTKVSRVSARFINRLKKSGKYC